MINGLDILSRTLQQDEENSNHNPAKQEGTWIQGECNWSPYWQILVRYCPNLHEYPCLPRAWQENYPEMSAPFAQANSPALDWIRANERLFAINTAILALIHPQQFSLGMNFLKAVIENPAKTIRTAVFPDILHAWVSPMTGFVLNSNSPIWSQQALGAKCEWYDILNACGNYEGEDLFLSEINLRLRLPQRTTIAICSPIFKYRVGNVMTGSRMVFTWYMSQCLWENLNISHHSSLPKLRNFP